MKQTFKMKLRVKAIIMAQKVNNLFSTEDLIHEASKIYKYLYDGVLINTDQE